MSEDVPGKSNVVYRLPSLFADVLAKPADLAIGAHNRGSVTRALYYISYIRLMNVWNYDRSDI